MRWFLSITMMFLVTLSRADEPGNETSKRMTRAEVMNFLPAGLDGTVLFNLNTLRNNRLFQAPIDECETTLNRDLEEKQVNRVARALGLRMDNVQSVFYAWKRSLPSGADAMDARVADSIWAVTFRKPVDVSNVLRLGGGNTSEQPKAEPPFVTEMMNGKIIFFERKQTVLVYQATPSLILVGHRRLIREATRINDPSVHAGNAMLKKVLNPGLPKPAIHGIVVLNRNGSTPEYVWFELLEKDTPSLVVHYPTSDNGHREHILERFRNGWKVDGNSLKAVFNGEWTSKITANRVTLTLPVSAKSATYLTQLALGQRVFIEALKTLAATETSDDVHGEISGED